MLDAMADPATRKVGTDARRTTESGVTVPVDAPKLIRMQIAMEPMSMPELNGATYVWGRGAGSGYFRK